MITLVPGGSGADRIELRPEGTRQTETINVDDVYSYALRCRVNAELLAKARERKTKLQERRATRRIEAAERRMRKPL